MTVLSKPTECEASSGDPLPTRPIVSGDTDGGTKDIPKPYPPRPSSLPTLPPPPTLPGLKAQDAVITESPQPTLPEAFIAVLGPTGTGKSTFINHVLGGAEAAKHVGIGHTLASCTEEITAVSTEINGQKVTLIDTPGFDDAVHDDARILMDVALWLRGAHIKDRLLNGVVYLHRITDIRMQAGSTRSLQILRKICGPEGYGNIVLATTRWSEVAPAIGESRERDLKTIYWRDVIELGGRVYRHNDGETSARKIITDMLSYQKIVLMIQKELADKDIVAETVAGKFVVDYVNKRVKELQSIDSSALLERIEKLENEKAEKEKKAQEERQGLEVELEKARSELEKTRGEINTMSADIQNLQMRIAELTAPPDGGPPDQFLARARWLMAGLWRNQVG